MLFPAKMDSYMDILKRVHAKFASAVKTGGELEKMAEKQQIVAGGLLARNIPLSELLGKYDDVLKELGNYLKNPSGFGSDSSLPSLKLYRKVSLFKVECETLQQAANFGIVGILAALLGESVAFVSPDSDNPPTRYEDWDVPNRIRMAWSIPTLRERTMHLNDSSRGTELVEFDAGGQEVDPDPMLATDVQYIAHMLYRRSVRRILRSLFLCESAGYAVTLLTGIGTPSSYYTTEEEDFLPKDVVDRMNQVMHYDPPTGYILRKEKDGIIGSRALFASYHAHTGLLPSMRDLVDTDAFTIKTLPPSVKDQLSAWYADDAAFKDSKWALIVTPQISHPVRDASRIAIDFAIQHVLAKTGALTPGTDSRHRWYRYYIRLDYSYSALLLDHLAVRGVVIENGAYSAYLTRFVINREEESGPVMASFMIFADRGFMGDRSDALGNPIIEIDGKRYSIEFTYTSEWIPSGPGLRPGDQDVGDDPGTIIPAFDDTFGTDSRFSPYSAYLVTISEEVKK